MRKLGKWVKSTFGAYKVVDSYGSAIICWSLGEAVDWLSACSPDAVVWNTYSCKMVAARTMVRAY